MRRRPPTISDLARTVRTLATPRVCRALLALAILLPLVGCAMEERVVSTGFGFDPDDGDQNAGWEASESPDGPTHEESGGTWAIALGRFTGDGHADKAEQMADRLADYAETDDVWVGQDRGGSMIYHGRYESRSDRVARADLRRWREYVRNGELRLPALMLVPVNEDGSSDRSVASTGEFALEQAAQQERARRQEQQGTDDPVRVYSLQIGMYDEDFGDDYRDAAEDAVASLREDGWEAYYWHGPVRSTITIGLFGDAALEDDTEEAMQLEALQRRFPHNSLNGRTIRERREDSVRDQPSMLVKTPGG